MNKTIIISNRLPIKITYENGKYLIQKSEGGLATGLADVYKNENMFWVGWPGMDIPKKDQPAIIKKLAALNLIPVFLSQEEINLYYEGFSNEILWPVFHYVVTYAKYEQSYWDSYLAVNEKFADATVAIFAEGDMVWVQDYQLLCAPAMLRNKLPNITIGFFLHIPFPSFEVFRLIPWRDHLIKGLLGADLIGFHTFDDVRHFIDTASRLAGVNFSGNTLILNNRQILVEPFPMGIDYQKFENLPNRSDVRAEIENLRSEQSGRLILSIDRLDYSKGILERLRALELLLQRHPKFIGEICLFMIVVPSRDSVPQYKELKERIDQLVGNINAQYRTLDWAPISYFYRSFPITTLSALYSVADICLVTPMRDGMNLVSKEYVASRTDNSGVLILSEMAGASKELNDAIIVNPNNIGDIMNAIVEGLTMPLEEQQKRMQNMRLVVNKFNVNRWVRNFIGRLEDTISLQHTLSTKYAINKVNRGIVNRYANTEKRIIFLDYDGTLVNFKGNINDASPDSELLDILGELAADENNTLVIVSGRNNKTLEQWFGHLPIDMIAEHGAWQKKKNSAWHMPTALSDHWKNDISNVLEAYTDRTPGSSVEEKSYSLVWHYRKAEQGLGEQRANEIMGNMRQVVADKGLQIMPGNKVIEIKNIEVNKGKAAMQWLHHYNYDFILAMGDDHTDEDLFRAMPSGAITIKIGSQASEAKFFLNNPTEVRELLKAMNEVKNKDIDTVL